VRTPTLKLLSSYFSMTSLQYKKVKFRKLQICKYAFDTVVVKVVTRSDSIFKLKKLFRKGGEGGMKLNGIAAHCIL
jgi:hypothetical protein